MIAINRRAILVGSASLAALVVARPARAWFPHGGDIGGGGGVTPPADAIPIANATALATVLNGSPATYGDKHYLLAATSFGAVGIYNKDFSAHPIHIWGQTGTTFDYIEINSCQGLNFHTFKVTGYNVSISYSAIGIQANPTATDPVSLSFDRVVIDQGNAEGVQGPGAGWYFRNLYNATITITGYGDASTPDISGAQYAMSWISCMNDAGQMTVQKMTTHNNNVDGFIATGVRNITFDRCLFFDFYGDGGGHPDAIQVAADLTLTGDAGRSKYITIRNCGVLQGLNGAGSQCYFFEDSDYVTVRGSWAHCGDFNNAFSVSRCTQVVLDDCYLEGVDAVGGAALVRGGTSYASITNNSYQSFGQINTDMDPVSGMVVPCSNITNTGNTINPRAATNTSYSGLDAWLASHLNARRRV